MNTDPTVADLQHRIHVLERRARTVRVTALVAFAALAGLAWRQAPQGTETRRARRLEIVDDRGVVRVAIGQDPKDTQRRSRACGLTVHDATGAERGGFSTMDDLSVVLGMDAPHGVGAPMRDRIGLQVDADSSASVGLIDNAQATLARAVLRLVDTVTAAHTALAPAARRRGLPRRQ